ncbi:hypothetical protein KSP40_PGU006670 [Platanthera guangdongensis]|uniref:methenyltetrahydrofolate cyclohydrolase n=1 Tax=Platanthera guangdongensis TaxID=2320717 RepID=A0ABR2LDG4_9ASPA
MLRLERVDEEEEDALETSAIRQQHVAFGRCRMCAASRKSKCFDYADSDGDVLVAGALVADEDSVGTGLRLLNATREGELRQAPYLKTLKIIKNEKKEPCCEKHLIVSFNWILDEFDPESARGYRLVGDVCFEEARKVASAITPVPGGVGPMTIAMLLSNTLSSAKRIHGIK